MNFKIVLFAIFSAVFSINTLSAQTTAEEYNYLTRGYKMQIESGLDMKAGYSFVDLGRYSAGNRSCEFKFLMRNATKETAATFAIFHAANGQTYYLCIPKSGSADELFKAYRTSLNQIDNAEAARDYSFFLGEMFENLINAAEGKSTNKTSPKVQF